jgi:hypothetical protein
MKKSFLAVALLALLILGSRDIQAQPYGPYYYDPYWDFQYQQYQQYQYYLQWQQYLAYAQQYDPYYELHVMHYQLYLQPYQPYQLYQPCCYAWGSYHSRRASANQTPPATRYGPTAPAGLGPRSQAPVSLLPRATAPLPPAVPSLPRATGRR